MKTQFVASLTVFLLCLSAAAQSRILTVIQTEDNQSRDIAISASETLEILTAYDFYGAASSLGCTKSKVQFYVVPGHAAGGAPQCTPYPLVLAGPAELSIQSGNTQGSRTENTPLLVTLKITRSEASPAPAKPVAKESK